MGFSSQNPRKIEFKKLNPIQKIEEITLNQKNSISNSKLYYTKLFVKTHD